MCSEFDCLFQTGGFKRVGMFDDILRGLSKDVNLKCLIMKTTDKLILYVRWREVMLAARTDKFTVLS